MTIFLTFLLGHLLADFPLQTNKIYHLKSRSAAGLLLHVSMHLLVMVVLLADPLAAWPVLLFLGGAHYLVDWVKLHAPGRYAWPGFLIDQLAHLSVLALIALAAPGIALRPMPNWLLILGIIGASVSAIVIFLWVLGGDIMRVRKPGTAGRRTLRTRKVMLLFSQRGGLMLVLGLVLTWLLVL